RRSFIAPGIPKMMVWGPYGSGKTQTLFYLEYYLKTETPSSAKGIPNTIYLLSLDEAAWVNGAVIRVDGGEHISGVSE
ncbi:MAG: hypothetical protein JRE57_18345, partial [Deltaproteobacteria bacterium]|nr:hypothetical protein [Deltaproteobacteria bacterium]